MIKISAGHYRDSFNRYVYEVAWSARPYCWRYRLKPLNGEWLRWSLGYATKDEAARAARLAIDEARREAAFKAANAKWPLPLSGEG